MGVNTILNRASCLALLLAASVPARAEQTASPCAEQIAATGPTLHVTATGARRVAGDIAFTLYGADPARFLKSHGSLAVIRVTLTSTRAAACFTVSSPGDYAVAIYHDENGNHHFDRNFLGLPVEGYGFSNDAPTYLGPPSFGAARIAIHAGDNTASIRLRY